MTKSMWGRTGLATLLAGAMMAGCDGSPTEPNGEVNARLGAEANGVGFGSGDTGLPQGAGLFTGPDGQVFDATAEEFIQQLSFDDGRVLRTSGIGIFGVSDPEEPAPALDLVTFGYANTGSLDSVDPGTYAITVFPQINFIDQVYVAHARIRRTGEEELFSAQEGEITLESVSYFNDTYQCELTTTLIIDVCEYQIGMVAGAIEFTVTLEDGTRVVQERAEFTLPIRRRTIIARYP